jgi:pyruvate,water dikinase
MTIPLNTSQQMALHELSNIISTQFNHGLAAVRSSAIEEDGIDMSYAGMFETELGVSANNLERAVRRCFASKFDSRVLLYMRSRCYNNNRSKRDDDDHNNEQKTKENDKTSTTTSTTTTTTTTFISGGFSLAVMEMVNSKIAGVAFSANPSNSDRDECVVDSSYGLGISVVDGSVTADRYVYDKVQKKIVQQVIGSKHVEKRLKLVEGDVETIPINDVERQNANSLSQEQLKELVYWVEVVEKAYGFPIDIEWAYTESNQLMLLQARPITTLFCLDENMMTGPGERRILYYDFNIASEATTTTPFTHMDMSLYCRMSNIMMGINEDITIFKNDPNLPMFNSETRQYMNLSFFFKFISTEYCAREAMVMDPYLSSLFSSKDCDRKRYRSKKRWPKGCNARNLLWLMRKIPIKRWYKSGRRFKKDPEKAKNEYIKVVENDMAKLKALRQRGFKREEGLKQFTSELCSCCVPSFSEELGAIYFIILGTFSSLDKKRRNGKSELCAEYDALCGGYEGDELMKINIDMYRLANKLDASIWEQYDHDELHHLAHRIQQNINGKLSDLPSEFLTEWSSFLDRHGYDGEDQMFISSPRYQDTPELLLARLRQNSGTGIKDPADIQREQVLKRRRVMNQQLESASARRFTRPFRPSRIRQRNAVLDHVMWIRNAPKLHIAQVIGVLRETVLQIEKELIEVNRLANKGDIFHLDLEEVDKALLDETFDLMQLVRPRLVAHERALKATECPLLIDSRCRILRPDPPNDVELGTILGTAVSPGTATGRVRVMKSPNERFESGEILAATVTSPAWTPLFCGASAVILQIGGVLQHGALCAREYGLPAVSNIDVHNVLKTGMLVAVDGNTGTIKIIEREDYDIVTLV